MLNNSFNFRLKQCQFDYLANVFSLNITKLGSRLMQIKTQV